MNFFGRKIVARRDALPSIFMAFFWGMSPFTIFPFALAFAIWLTLQTAPNLGPWFIFIIPLLFIVSMFFLRHVSKSARRKIINPHTAFAYLLIMAAVEASIKSKTWTLLLPSGVLVSIFYLACCFKIEGTRRFSKPYSLVLSIWLSFICIGFVTGFEISKKLYLAPIIRKLFTPLENDSEYPPGSGDFFPDNRPGE